MDEEVIKRIVYIVLGIILFLVFKKKNKKTVKESVAPKRTSNQPYGSTQPQKNEPYFPPVDTVKNEEYKSVRVEKTILEKGISDLETIEDEVTANHKLINKKKSQNVILHEEKTEKFTVTEEEWKKAIILSDIITPKYF